jgi:hypothetical protein
LGEQYDISAVRNAAAVSRYVGKYLFKSSLLTSWPDGWKRVRYSQNWPKSSREETEAIPLITAADYFNLATIADTVLCADRAIYGDLVERFWAYPVQVKLKKTQEEKYHVSKAG